jgi:CRP/FNR family transcriptional regulator, cyclic AMP receptor protein
MDTKTELLKQVPLFAGFSRDELRAVAAVADELDVPAGRALTRQGEPGREFVVLVDGEATVEENGKAVATLGRGDFLGEIALLTRSPRTATVTTTAPSRLLVLSDRAFRVLADTVPNFAARTWAATAARMPG